MSLISTSRRPLPLRLLRLLSSSASVDPTPPTSAIDSEFDLKAVISLLAANRPPLPYEFVDPTPPTSAVDPTIRSFARQRHFSRHGRFFFIDSLIDRQINSPNAGELVRLILNRAAAGTIDLAIRTFEKAPDTLPRSAASFNALLAACSRSKRDHRRVPDLFVDLSSKHSITPDAVSYSILIKAHCLARNASKNALPILKEMESKKLEINTVVYTTILDSLYRERDPEQAEKLWKEMCSKGRELDLPPYYIRAKYRAIIREPESVLELIGEMESNGLKPDTIIYNCLISCYCNHGKIMDAMKVYEGLEEKGCVSNVATFKYWLIALCKRGDLDEALKVFTESVKADKVPDIETVKHMMEKLVEGSKVGAAKKMVKWLKEEYPNKFVQDWKALEEIVLEADGETSKEDAEIVSA